MSDKIHLIHAIDDPVDQHAFGSGKNIYCWLEQGYSLNDLHTLEKHHIKNFLRKNKYFVIIVILLLLIIIFMVVIIIVKIY